MPLVRRIHTAASSALTARYSSRPQDSHKVHAGHAIQDIFEAVEVGTPDDVNRMLSASTLDERESRNQLGQQLIQSACWHGRGPALRLLATRFGCSLRCKWDHTAAPVDDQTTLAFNAAPLAALAAARNHAHCLSILAELLPSGALSKTRDAGDRYAAHYAAAGGAADSLRVLQELELAGPPGTGTLSAPDAMGRTPAHVAAECGRTDALRALHDLKADLGASDQKGRTPLHAAAITGQIEAIVLLADLLPKHVLDAYDHDGMRALHVASRDNQPAVIAALVNAGADLYVQDRDGRTAAHWAAAEGCTEALRQLAAVKAPLAMPDNAGHSPAYLAGGGQHNDCLAVLAKSAPRHLGATAGFTAQAVRPKAYVPDELPTFDPRIYARNLARVKARP